MLVGAGLYQNGITNGRGYIGLAAMIFGNWRPSGLLVGSALFGYTDALQLRAGGGAVHALLLVIAIVLLAYGILLLRRGSRRSRRGHRGARRCCSPCGSSRTDEVPERLHPDDAYVATLFVLALRRPAAANAGGRRAEIPPRGGGLTWRRVPPDGALAAPARARRPR